MQRGTILKQSGNWCIRYYDSVIRDSRVVRKKVFKVLAPVNKSYPSKASVRLLADKLLTPVNTKHQTPESSLTLSDFIENHYLKYAKRELRPSTVKGYKDLFNNHLKERTKDVTLKDFRTVHAQRLIADINTKGQIGHKSLLRVKSLLSGVITYALREGILDGANPVRPVKVPGRPTKFKAPWYSLQEVIDLGEAVFQYDRARKPKKFAQNPIPQGVANAAICVAAYAGLRLSEIRGLTWGDYKDGSLNIARSVWGSYVGPTKTLESESAVPVIPILAVALDALKPKDPQDKDYIFAGPRCGASLNLNNLCERIIKPALKDKGIPWKGWHAFRRGLATNLLELRVEPKTIAGILRHDVGTMLRHYAQADEQKGREALAKVTEWMKDAEPSTTYEIGVLK